MKSKLLTIKDASEYLGVSYHNCLNSVKDGSVPSHKLGKRYFIERKVLDKLFNASDEASDESVKEENEYLPPVETGSREIFKTRDFYLATYLYLQKHELISVDRQNPQEIWFKFEDSISIKTDMDNFYDHKANVDALDMMRTSKFIKSLMYKERYN